MGQFDAFVNRYFDVRFVAPVTQYGVRCWLATNQQGGGVSYATSLLGYERVAAATASRSVSVTGEFTQLFDDRHGRSGHSFDPDSGDRIIVPLRPTLPVDPRSLS